MQKHPNSQFKPQCSGAVNAVVRPLAHSQPISPSHPPHTFQSPPTHAYSPVKNSSKLNVIYPSRSSSYFLKTSVILFKIIQLCTNKSKLILPCPLLSYVVYISSTNEGESRYPNAISAFVYSEKEMLPLPSSSKRSKSCRQEARKAHSLL